MGSKFPTVMLFIGAWLTNIIQRFIVRNGVWSMNDEDHHVGRFYSTHNGFAYRGRKVDVVFLDWCSYSCVLQLKRSLQTLAMQ